MKCVITRWTTTLATAAALGLPAASLAQTPQPAPQEQQQPPAQQPKAQPPSPRQSSPQYPPAQQTPAQERPAARTPQPESTEPLAPQDHIREAKAALGSIQPASVTGRARTQIAALTRHLTALESASAMPADAPRTTQKTTGRATKSWDTEVAAIDKILTELLAADPMAGAVGATGTTGTTGSAKSKPAKAVGLDEATRSKLMDVRKHVTAYAASMSGNQNPPKTDAAVTDAQPSAAPASPTPSAAPAPSATPTPSAAPTPSADPTPSAAPTPSAHPTPSAAPTPSAHPTPSAAPTPSADPSAAPTPSASSTTSASPMPASGQTDMRQQADPEAARRHLMAARETLTQLTQVPAAAQLTGETRTQVSQLIANFNELITTQSQWRASHAKVAANLTALLGPAAPTAAAPSVTTETAATGIVGTSGTTKADIDPAVRAKLVELRNNLTEFEKAMGGPAPDGAK